MNKTKRKRKEDNMLGDKQEDNEIKKEYLNRYIDCKRASKRIEEQIEELKTNKMFPSMVISGMPSAHSKSDLSDYIVKLDELISELIRARYKKINTYTEIFKQIEIIDDENEKEVLTLKYINGYKWEFIADEMNYSCRQIHNIHRNALSKFIL